MDTVVKPRPRDEMLGVGMSAGVHRRIRMLRARPRLFVLLFGFVLAACSAPAAFQQQARAPQPAGSATAPQIANGSASAVAQDASASSSTPSDAALPPLDRMVVSTVNLSLTASNAVNAERQAESIATRDGGFVASSNVRDVDGGRQ